VANAVNWTQIQLNNGLVQWVFKAGTPISQRFMLNVDVGLVRDLEGFGFLPECNFKPPKQCPLATTLSKTGVYRNNNLLWLADFKAALVSMLNKGRGK
jgi:hypothetical protein